MPVEIRELIVRAVVSAECSQKGKSPGGCPDEKEITLEECVEKALEIMKENQER